MRDADIAMYKAKSLGKARMRVFDSAMHAEVSTQLWMEGELRRAFDSSASCTWTSSRSSICARSSFTASRPSPAGRTLCAATSGRTSSSRSPRRPG